MTLLRILILFIYLVFEIYFAYILFLWMIELVDLVLIVNDFALEKSRTTSCLCLNVVVLFHSIILNNYLIIA